MTCHLMGIGGVGMAGLAVLLKARGHAVTGCDLRDSPRLAFLRQAGIEVTLGHDPGHLAKADAVIYTPAVPADHPEFLAAGPRLRSRGETLAEIVSAAPDAIAVCGSHGKTTTATFVAKLLTALGEQVEWAIGGETGAWPVAGGAAGGVLVVEADESDGTLAKYAATTLVITNCDYDHADHFPTRADYAACFERARERTRERNGTVVEAGELTEPAGLSALAAFQALAEHNRRNALAAVEVALRRGHSLAKVLAALPEVVAELPDRRFQTVSSAAGGAGWTVVTDYAHHPAEIKCALAMARDKCRGVLRVLFQPHRYSRTRALLAEFPAAFGLADEVVVCPTYAAFEKPVEGGSSADLYAACRAAGGKPRFYLSRTVDEAWEHAWRSMQAGDLTLLLGAGDIVKLLPRVRESVLGKGSDPLPERRIWIGEGTNTWKSDLNLGVEYVRTQGPAGRPGASLKIPWMAGIPGTIGGWVKMNAGAFGHSISEVVRRVKVDGRWLDAADCGFGYRTSAIVGEIEDVAFGVLPQDAPGATAADFLTRRKRFPAGTNGSVFKNPPNDFAGRLLEEAGVKGLRVGGARVWEEHANVIVADADATASDFLALATLMRERVYFRFGIRLEPEVCGIGAVRAIVALGSNLEPRADYLAQALAALAALPETRLVAASSVIETEPVGVPAEFAALKFLNQAAVFETMLTAIDFSRRMHAIEDALGRVRTVCNAPRTIDLDLIDFGGMRMLTEELTLPHPRFRERDFVLKPLAELGVNLV